ncbi:hypothetical protein NHX12_021106 [Muraenolepis orangiensis]|uniref:Chemokine interleukin-8-like domain-containing protein n=1 Tax=Muraenolepis orangiensis TaxID=630683 RepID=A0A9Q0ET53_9TELE|nr:hypothetical protein NHX12_021106 [Muraenolepis orangiensis]
MVACATVMKSLLLAAIVAVLTGHGSAAEKFGNCCTKVSGKEMTEPILSYKLQFRSGHCVNAVIFQTETGWNCVQFNAPWVKAKIRELQLGARTTS